MNRIRLVVLTLVLAVASAGASASASNGPAGPASAASRGGTAPKAAPLRGHGLTLSVVGRKSLAQAAASGAATPSAGGGSLPLLTRNPRAVASAKGQPKSANAPVRRVASSSPKVTATPQVVDAGPFVLESDATDVATFGGSIEPPDTQLAAGPTQLFELVNNVGQVFTKAGAAVTAPLQLQSFFPVPAGMNFTDPRILFDSESSRWFVSGLGFDATRFQSRLIVGVSSTSDATSTFNFVQIPFDGANSSICDQPKLGVNTDKVSVSCSNFTSSTTFAFESMFFINKSDMLAATTTPISVHSWRIDDNRLFSVEPVTSLTPTPTEFLVENDSGGAFCGTSSLWLAAVTGVPSATQPNPPGIPVLCFHMTATSAPPNAAQPAGGNATVNTGDDRLLSAVWRNGILWTGGNDACTPNGDTQVRSCMRLETIQTLDSLMQFIDYASNGAYLYYPGLALDGSNDVFVSYTESASNVNPEAVAFDLPAFSFSPEAFTVVEAGAAAYNSLNSTPRWGDYSAAAVDPANNANVWVTAEFAAAAGNFNWSTATEELSVPAPTASTINPSSGPAAGGQPVTITGTAFHPGATVSFGSNLATSVAVAPGGTSLTATTPIGTVGATTVTVKNPDGSSATVPGGYTYVAPAAVGTTFFFAEGNTISGFTETLHLFAPNTTGTAQVTYQTDTGPVGPISHAVTAGQVTNVDVLSDLGGVSHIGVSARVDLPGPGVAERELDFNLTSPNPNWHGSETKVGVTAANTNWEFAEGSTHPAYSEFLTLQNPDPNTASSVSIDYFTDRGTVVHKTLTIAAQHRVTVTVFDSSSSTNCTIDPNTGAAAGCGVGPGVIGVSAQVQVTSGPAIVAERPMYVNGFDFGSGPIRDGHDAFGANGAAATWNFAEGTTIGGFNEYLTLLNPDTSTASNVNIDYFTEQGAHVTKSITLPHSSRTTVEVFLGAVTNSTCSILSGIAQNCGVGAPITGVSTRVSVTSGPNIVAERPMYISFDFGTGIVAGADDVVGATSLGTVFGFSASRTTTGENDYLTIQNSGSTAANVTIAYYDAATGFPQSKNVVVFGNSRRTVRTFLPPSLGPGDIGPGFNNLGVVVSSDQPILVEMPTYNSNVAQYGATDTIGFTPNPAF